MYLVHIQPLYYLFYSFFLSPFVIPNSSPFTKKCFEIYKGIKNRQKHKLGK